LALSLLPQKRPELDYCFSPDFSGPRVVEFSAERCVVRIYQILQNTVMTDDQTSSERVTGSWVSVPMAPELREQIKRAAEADHRSVASWARVALIERLASQERAA
jgi:hypothetical protein